MMDSPVSEEVSKEVILGTCTDAGEYSGFGVSEGRGRGKDGGD